MERNNHLDNDVQFKQHFLKHFAYWPIYLISIVFFIAAGYIYLRYSTVIYRSNAKIEIIDKSQDSEMALPTAMTVFNRSMINLDNEIGVLSSYSLHKRVVESLNSNIRYYVEGNIKTSELSRNEFFKNFDIEIKTDFNEFTNPREYVLNIDENSIKIEEYVGGRFSNSYSSKSLTTFENPNDLPFNLKVTKIPNDNLNRIIKIFPLDLIIDEYRNKISISSSASESDQLNISMLHQNYSLSNEYLNTLINEFDKDGVVDRQLEYKRTMDFVDSRSVFLLDELELVEKRKQEFKQKNNLSDLKTDANLNVNQKFTYDSDLFDARSQKDLVILLKNVLNEKSYELMPINVGVESGNINNLINEYNLSVKDRKRYLLSAGKNNPYIKNLESQLDDLSKAILESIDNYMISLETTISNLQTREKQFSKVYNTVPENEKILRAIERELEVKESLFLLLLQKREEAAINYAVVKPSIKIIDSARNLKYPISPNNQLIYLFSLLCGLLVPFSSLVTYFYFDNKIHSKSQMQKLLPEIPIVGEIPYVSSNVDLNKVVDNKSRNVIAESIRMLSANLNFTLFNNLDKKAKKNIILVTSTIKGEGKTMVSINTASSISYKGYKVLLVGADLRNPQIHKYIGLDKSSKKGLSNFIYEKNIDVNDIIIKNKNFDIILSGAIPPNPTELLSSKKFNDFINLVSNKYDYVIFDSAPCLLVSDTFEISKYVNLTLYVFRCNYTKKNLIEFIKDSKTQNKLINLNLVLNGVGQNSGYGYSYKYGYQYGYQYGYNYGYGYGYNEDLN